MLNSWSGTNCLKSKWIMLEEVASYIHLRHHISVRHGLFLLPHLFPKPFNAHLITQSLKLVFLENFRTENQQPMSAYFLLQLFFPNSPRHGHTHPEDGSKVLQPSDTFYNKLLQNDCYYWEFIQSKSRIKSIRKIKQ